MKITLIRNDGVVLVDGRAFHVDLSDLPANIHAVQWDGAKGHIEYINQANKSIASPAAFQPWVARWQAARDAADAPHVPTADEIAQEQQRQADTAARDAVKADAIIKYLATHTPNECNAYVQANVTNLADAKTLLGKFAMALSVLVRGSLR